MLDGKPPTERIPILKMGELLLVTIQVEMHDRLVMGLQDELTEQIVRHRDALKADLTDVPGTLAEVALQFCLSHPAVATVIPGMRRVKTVESSTAVSDRGPLPPPVRERLKKHAWFRNFYQ